MEVVGVSSLMGKQHANQALLAQSRHQYKSAQARRGRDVAQMRAGVFGGDDLGRRQAFLESRILQHGLGGFMAGGNPLTAFAPKQGSML